MSKSAPTTPQRLWHREDFVEPNSTVSFANTPSVRYINKPPYTEEKQSWENGELNKKNSPLPEPENINQNVASSDSEESYSDQEEVIVLLLPNDSESTDANISDDEHKESGDDKRFKPGLGSYKGESEEDEDSEYEEGDEYSESASEADEGESEECESDYYEEGYGNSESESEDEYQEPKRYKLTKAEAPSFPDYAALTAKYEASLKQGVAQISPAAATSDPVDKPEKLEQLGKRKQLASETEYDMAERHQPKHYKPTEKALAIFPDYTALTRDYEASLKANEVQSSPAVAAAAPGNEQKQQYAYLGKRSRDEFEEENKNLKLLIQTKNEILKAFNEKSPDPGYYSENSDYEEEQETFSPLSPLTLRSSSASSPMPSPYDDLSGTSLAESPASFPDETYAGHQEDTDDYSESNSGRDGAVARYWWDNQPDEEDLCQYFSSAAITDAAKPSFSKKDLGAYMSDDTAVASTFVESSGEATCLNSDLS